MFDATAKPPSGVLSGNGVQYGDFDECLSIDGTVKGKYCLASMQVSIHGDDSMKTVDYLQPYITHGSHTVRSNLTDPGHRLFRYSSLLWGICIPSSCSNYNLEEELSQRLSDFGITVRVDSDMCTLKDNKTSYSFGKIISIAYFLAIVLLLSLSTVLDDGKEGLTKFKKILNAFSLRRNLRYLFDLSNYPDNVKGVNAYRGLNAVPIILIHKCVIMAFNPVVNSVTYFNIMKSILGLPLRLPTLYVDSFLYVSGFLNAYSLLHELELTGTIHFINRFISRWFRIFPLFMSTILLSTYIMPDVNNGPQWNLMVTEEKRYCEKNIWYNIFFMHNYLSPEEMCLPYTHQIGTDMQLYVITIPVMLAIWKYGAFGWSLLAITAVLSTILRYLVVYWYDISMILKSDLLPQNFLNMAKNSYMLPPHKSTIYIIGVVIAYLIKYKMINVKLSNKQSRVLWFFCFGLGVMTILSPYRMSQEGYQYEHFPEALYAAFSPILWGLFLGISHWAIYNDYAGIGTSFLESRVFKFYQKISYSVYLMQIPIFMYNVAVQRNTGYMSILIIDIPEIIAIFVISIIMTVAIERPFINLYKVYFGQSSKKLKHE